MTSTTIATIPGASRPGFTNALVSELTKLRSVRSTYIQALLTVVLGIGMTALIALAIGSTWDEVSVEERATFDPVNVSSFGSIFALIVLVVLGVMFVSSEYTSGMIRLTLTTTPRRLRVLAAKSLIIIAVVLVLGVIVSVGSFYAGQAVLGSYEGVPTASLSDEGAVRSVVGVWLLMPVFPLLGAAAAFVLRSTASTITAILGLIFVPAIFGGIFPDSIQENVIKFLPSFAIDSVTTTDPGGDSLTRLNEGAALAVIAAWLFVFFFAAYVSLMRRDV